MDLNEAILARHSVRKYTDRPVEAEKVIALEEKIAEVNSLSGLHIQLVRNEPQAFSPGIWQYGAFSGVRNYFAMVGPEGKEAEEKIGYFGEQLVLLAQTLGLNTCWVGLTFSKISDAYTVAPGEKLHCVIAVGHGENTGIQHKLKPVEKFCKVPGDMPGWFRQGMEAALLAPTAVNQQKFEFVLLPDGKVEARTRFTFNAYAHIDLGIVKCHFELGAGLNHFEWAV